MGITLEVWKRSTQSCPDCGGTRVAYSGAVNSGEETEAVFLAFLYDHPGNPEVFLDVTFGTWGSDDPESYADHVTFGARTGSVQEPPGISCTLVQAASTAPADSPHLGDRLNRERALSHPLLLRFWAVNDLVLEEIEEIGRLFTDQRSGRPGGPPSAGSTMTGRSWFRRRRIRRHRPGSSSL